MMILRMFIIFFGLLIGYYAILELVVPYLQYYGTKVKVKLHQKLGDLVIYYSPVVR